jgi:phage major head subunit gpT-like protein
MQASAYQIVNKPYEATVGVDKFKIEDDKIGIYTPMMREYGRAVGVFPDEIIFGLLRNGFSSTCYDGQYFFDADHPVNSQADGQGAVTSVSNVLIDNDYTGDAWYLLDTNRAIKPLIYQVRSQPNFVALTREDDEAVFTTHEYRYGVDLRANGGYGPWQMAFGAKATLNASNLWAAHSAMSAVKADGGRPLGIYPNLLVVPTSLEREAVQLLNRDLFADGGEVVSNELKGKFGLLVSRYL